MSIQYDKVLQKLPFVSPKGEPMNPTTNPITVQSKEMYVNALLELMKEKPYNQISISELSCKADLSRRTFYRLFHSMDEILLFHIHRLWAQKSRELYCSSDKSYLHTSEFALHFWHENKELTILLYRNGLVSIMQQFINEISLEIYHAQNENPKLAENPEALEYALSYSSGGILNIICTWASKGMDKSPEELLSLLKLALN
ncbi:MAG: TetR/AcrR family transcriptional regulator C-terminal domain-containing protein [Lachnospiraceae bacterium]